MSQPDCKKICSRCLDSKVCFVKLLFISQKYYVTRALVSYPGSGNTWLRYLVEIMTGMNTSEERDSVSDRTSEKSIIDGNKKGNKKYQF